MIKRKESRKIWISTKNSISESGHRTCCLCSAVVPTKEIRKYRIIHRICQKCFDRVMKEE